MVQQEWVWVFFFGLLRTLILTRGIWVGIPRTLPCKQAGGRQHFCNPSTAGQTGRSWELTSQPVYWTSEIQSHWQTLSLGNMAESNRGRHQCFLPASTYAWKVKTLAPIKGICITPGPPNLSLQHFIYLYNRHAVNSWNILDKENLLFQLACF